jgi:hypothetical protein
MNYILCFLLAVYVLTGLFIGFKLPFKHWIGKALASMYFAVLWLPILIADMVIRRMEV